MGNKVWAKRGGQSGYDSGLGICTDGSQNVYVTGTSNSAFVNFGTGTISNNGGYEDMFVAKFDSGGNFIWGKSAGGLSFDAGTAVAADNNGNVFISGFFKSATLTVGPTTLTNSGGVIPEEMFVLKYDAIGNPIWAFSTGGNKRENGVGLACGLNGTIFLSGIYESDSVSFGASTLGNLYPDRFDCVIAKLDGGSTKVPTISKHESFSIFPNPNQGLFYIRQASNAVAEISIYSPNGICVYKFRYSELNHVINISHQPKGSYFYIVSYPNGSHASGTLLIR
jgi:hypothetical protein